MGKIRKRKKEEIKKGEIKCKNNNFFYYQIKGKMIKGKMGDKNLEKGKRGSQWENKVK